MVQVTRFHRACLRVLFGFGVIGVEISLRSWFLLCFFEGRGLESRSI